MLICDMRLEIPENLIPKLRELQSKQNYSDEVLKSEDAVVMTLGLGPAMYLTFDGRVIMHTYIDDEPPGEVSDPKIAYSAIVIGAKMRESQELLSILPAPPNDALDCSACTGSGWTYFMNDIDGKPIGLICVECGGIGWVGGI
jgi:hypothetical protein